jgi:uncharacterized coiled-coil protein SlyX
MKFFGIILVALNFFSMIGEAKCSESEGTIGDLTKVVSLLADRIDALEKTSKNDEDVIFALGDVVLDLESKLEQLEETVKKDKKKISSLENMIRSVEQRNLQLFNGPITNRPGTGSASTGSASTGSVGSAIDMITANINGANVCMPRYVNNRCIFGNAGIVAFRFENATFFNDDVEFNENVGFDEDADCMPIYNSTSRQCVLNNNFIYESGTHQYQSGSRVIVRSRELWLRSRKTYFRNTNTSFTGGAINIKDDVDYNRE